MIEDFLVLYSVYKCYPEVMFFSFGLAKGTYETMHFWFSGGRITRGNQFCFHSLYPPLLPPPSPSPLFKVGCEFHLPPSEGRGIWKTKKGGGSMVQGQVFNCFKVYHFYIQKLFYSAKLCYIFEEKLVFSAIIILWKTVILSVLKINLNVNNLNGNDCKSEVDFAPFVTLFLAQNPQRIESFWNLPFIWKISSPSPCSKLKHGVDYAVWWYGTSFKKLMLFCQFLVLRWLQPWQI